MKDTINVGMTHQTTQKVEFKHTAAAMGNEGVEVYSTPHMLELMELTCKELMDPYLDEGEGSVGMSVDLKHLGATPIGMTITCDAELIAVEGKKLSFKLTCRDDAEKVGEAVHHRFVIDMKPFLENVAKKKAKFEAQ